MNKEIALTTYKWDNLKWPSASNKIISIFCWAVFLILADRVNEDSTNSDFDMYKVQFSERIKSILDSFIEKYLIEVDLPLIEESEIIAQKTQEIEPIISWTLNSAIEMTPVITNSLEKIDLEKFWFSEVLEKQLTELILALIAKESTFNPNSISKANALWLFQITPWTYISFKNKYWSDQRFSHIFRWNMDTLLSDVRKQIEFYFLHAYDVNSTFIKSSTVELEEIKEKYFYWDSEKFDKHFLSYVLLNSYNSWWNPFNKSMFWDFVSYLDNLDISEDELKDPLFLFNNLTEFLKDNKWNNYWNQASSYVINILSINEFYKMNWLIDFK